MNGIINVLKPPGMTSSNVVSDVRRLLSVKKAGHTGTLDPGAAGVLPVCIGKATKLFDYLANKDKQYIAEVRFGISTDTQDAYGHIINQRHCSVGADEFMAVCAEFIGRGMQVPSSYSAIKINGQKAYQFARRGQEVDLAHRAREINIYAIELIQQTEHGFIIKVDCSKGTYIRQLAEQIGEKLGVPSYLAFLLRTVSGKYRLQDSYSIAELAAMQEQHDMSFLLPIDSALDMPVVTIDPCYYKKLSNGNQVEIIHADCRQLRVYCNNQFFGIGSITMGVLTMTTMFFGGQNEENC